MSDVTRPIKAKLTEYLKFEDHLQNMIWNHFISEPLSDTEKKAIFEIDDEMLSYEFILSRPTLEFINPTIVEDEFISLSAEIGTPTS